MYVAWTEDLSRGTPIGCIWTSSWYLEKEEVIRKSDTNLGVDGSTRQNLGLLLGLGKELEQSVSES